MAKIPEIGKTMVQPNTALKNSIASAGSVLSELLGVAYTQIRNPDSNLSLLGRS